MMWDFWVRSGGSTVSSPIVLLEQVLLRWELMRNSGYDETEAFSHGDRGFRNCEKVSPIRFTPTLSISPPVQESLWLSASCGLPRG